MGAGADNHDTRNYGLFALFSFLTFLLPWFLTVHQVYTIPRNRLFVAYYYSAIATPKNIYLILSLIVGLILAISLFVFLMKFTKTNFGGAKFHQKLRGVEMINKFRFSQITKEKGQQLSFIGVPVPKNAEPLHFFFGGSTGGGKTVAILNLMKSAIERKSDRILCVDPNGGYLEYFYKKGDIILNPFDKRGTGWSIFNEIKTRFDVEQYSVSMIPKSPSTEQEAFNSMARVLVSETMLKIWESREPETDCNAELFYWLITAPNDDLFEYLAGTPAQGLFGASETFGSIKAVLTQYIKPHKYLSNGDFSIREFLDNPNAGNLWITWREDQLAALKPLISCWIDVICAAILSMRPNNEQQKPFLLVLDEMDSLEKLNYIVQALTKGRKHKLSVVGGIQTLAQLDDKYGRDEALTVRNSFGSYAVCPVVSLDTYTPKQMAEAFGQHEVTRYQNNVTVGTGGGKGSRQLQKETESVVTATEITGLKALQFYFRIAQLAYVCKNELPYPKYPKVTTGYIEAENEWTEKRT